MLSDPLLKYGDLKVKECGLDHADAMNVQLFYD